MNTVNTSVNIGTTVPIAPKNATDAPQFHASTRSFSFSNEDGAAKFNQDRTLDLLTQEQICTTDEFPAEGAGVERQEWGGGGISCPILGQGSSGPISGRAADVVDNFAPDCSADCTTDFRTKLPSESGEVAESRKGGEVEVEGGAGEVVGREGVEDVVLCVFGGGCEEEGVCGAKGKEGEKTDERQREEEGRSVNRKQEEEESKRRCALSSGGSAVLMKDAGGGSIGCGDVLEAHRGASEGEEGGAGGVGEGGGVRRGVGGGGGGGGGGGETGAGEGSEGLGGEGKEEGGVKAGEEEGGYEGSGEEGSGDSDTSDLEVASLEEAIRQAVLYSLNQSLN